MTIGHADLNLEVVFLPVSDVDRSKEFYKVLRWREDADIMASNDVRIVQLTPPGSGASISFGTGVTTMTLDRSRDCCSSRTTRGRSS